MGINRTAQYIKNTLYCIIVEKARILAQCQVWMLCTSFVSCKICRIYHYTVVVSWILCNWQSLNYKVFLDTFNVLDLTLQCHNTFCCLLMACAPYIMLIMCEFYKLPNDLLLRYLASITLKIWIQTLYKSSFRFKNADISWLVTVWDLC